MALNHSITVDILNHQDVKLLMPLLVYLGIIMLTGIPGNILVIVIYRKNAGKSNYQFFITCLAVVDCITCCIVPFIINKAVHQYTFRGNWICKLTIFLQCWPTFISCGTLCVITIDRYRMVCKPHGQQITKRMAKIIVAIFGFISVLLSSPSLVLFGVRETQIHPYNLTSTKCAVLSEYRNTAYIHLFNGLLWILFIIALTIIVVLYIFIGKGIFQHAKTCNRETPTTRTLNSKPVVAVGGNVSIKANASSTRKEKHNMSNSSVEIELSNEPSADSGFTVTDTELDSVNQKVHRDKRVATGFSKASRMQSKKESNARQAVFIMFLISLLFIISFLPQLILRFLGAVNVDLSYTKTDEGRAIYKFFLNSYFINSAVNPIVYCACSTKFREDAKALLFGRTRH